MNSIVQGPVPDDALLKTYRGGARPELWGIYGDCFSVSIDRPVSLAEFVTAFYTTPVFRLERLILRAAIGVASTDEDARQVAAGMRDSFAAWRVGERTDTQLLMCDRYENTRSWFRVTPQGFAGTVLQFGSGIAARRRADGELRMSPTFGILLGFHKLYSRLLLRSALWRLRRAPKPE
jgi:hypothetical protein